jgi:hypothetical protein
MARGGALRFAGLIFLICLVSYAALFGLDQWARTRRGPWNVTFSTAPDGTPRLDIREPRLGIEGVAIEFEGERATNTLQSVAFDTPERAVPFGQLVFSDTTYLPGTVTLHCFGHEVEMLPRTLLVNRREIPWKKGLTLRLTPSDKPASLPPPKKIKKR